jgi:uracil-DNA glycosylase family 4
VTPAAQDAHPLAGLLAFWAEAGVETAYTEAPVDRLAEGARRLAPKPPPSTVAAPVTRKPASAATPVTDPELLAHARAAAAAAADLPALETATTVFARGAPDAEVMIVGEGPGADEDRQGQPFVGRSGQLLDRMLAAGGLTGRVFITNTVFWRPPGNRTPTPTEQALCAPFLERAVTLVNPRVLLLAGGAAAKSMLGRSEGITALRGRWFDWTAEGGDTVFPALPTLHPAFLLRQPAAKAQAWLDILSLLSRLDPVGRLGHR